MKILFVEDIPTDAELAIKELQKAGIQFTFINVDTKETFLKALKEFQPTLIISDYLLPQFNGLQAFKLTLKYDA